MLSRIHLFPDSAESGSAPATPAVPAAPATPTVTPSPPAKPDNADLLARLAALESKNSEYERRESERQGVERAAKEEELKKNGEFKELLKRRDTELEEARNTAKAAAEKSKAFALGKELASVLGSHGLVPGGAKQLATLWHSDFKVEEENGEYIVIGRDLRSVADVVKERLGSDEYAHFVKAEHRGGGGVQSGGNATPTNQQGKPLSLEASVLAKIKEQQATAAANGLPASIGW